MGQDDHVPNTSCDTAIDGSAQELAAQYEPNQKTVAKSRKRTFVQDTPIRAKGVLGPA